MYVKTPGQTIMAILVALSTGKYDQKGGFTRFTLSGTFLWLYLLYFSKFLQK